VTFKWQGGLFFFTQNYDQNAVNGYSAGVLPFIPFAVEEHAPESALDDRGVGVYGEGTFTFGGRFDATLGLRADHETKEADVRTFYQPNIGAPDSQVVAERDFTDISPQATVAFRPAPRTSIYGTVSRGFKAGGFNAASPSGSEAYGEEHSWNYEGGIKSSWLGDRLWVNGAAFYVDWRDLQVNLPSPFVPAQFYLANVGKASSKGVELELSARPAADLDVFGSLGYTNARFSDGSTSGGVDVGGKKLSNTPSYTANFGVQYSKVVAPSSGTVLYGRAEVARYGEYHFDHANTASQEAFALANLRTGVRVRNLFVEAWMRNAFDEHYVLTAFPFGSPSGFIGELGPPRTFGARVGATF
jgi:iron complex outermembrane receptor protein